MRLAFWDDGLALFRQDGTDWRVDHADPEIVLLDGLSNMPGTDYHRFVQSIPLEVRRLVTPIFRHQLTLLRLVRHCEGALDLLRSAPVLAWLLAGHLSQRFDVAIANRRLRKRRVAMLSAILGRRVTPAAVRVAARYTPGRWWSAHAEQILRRTLEDPRLVAWCAHEPRLYPRLLRDLVRYRRFADARFFRPAIRWRRDACAPPKTILFEAKSAIADGRALGRADAERVVFACAKPEHVRSLRRAWRTERERRERAGFAAMIRSGHVTGPFPAVPLAGSESIVPITSPLELVAEADEMGHCILDDLVEIWAGIVYVYRVLAPERATLEVDLTGAGGEVTILQLRGPRNVDVGEDTHVAVRQWVAARGGCQKRAAGGVQEAR
jgi:hypothetical protein